MERMKRCTIIVFSIERSFDDCAGSLLNSRFHCHLSHREGFQVPGYTRRQLKEDKFAETAQGAALWATGHRQTVIWTVGLALIGRPVNGRGNHVAQPPIR